MSSSMLSKTSPRVSVTYQYQTNAEVLARLPEFRALTSEDSSSDLNILLDDLLAGKSPIIAALSAEVGSMLVGWVAYERLPRRGKRTSYIVNTFVLPEYRYQGIANSLLTLLFQHPQVAETKILVDPELESFCSRFPRLRVYDT